jgi:hypothetical protein
MRRLFLVGTFCFLPFRGWAIHSPVDSNDVRATDDLIRSGNSIQNAIDLKQGNLAVLEGKDYKTAQDRADIALLDVQIKGLKRDRDVVFHQAIKKTLVVYGLAPDNGSGLPVMPTGMTVHPHYKGRQAEWIVIYQGDPERTMFDNNGRPDSIKRDLLQCGPRGCGHTGSDGVTVIYGQLSTAGDLAVLLFHEQIHFQQFTTSGQGDRLTHNDREIQAWQTTYDNVKDFGLPAWQENAWLLQSAEKGAAYKTRKAKRTLREKARDLLTPTVFAPGESPHTDEELASIKQRARELDEQIQREAEERHREVPGPPVVTPPGMPYVPPPAATPPGRPFVPGPGEPQAEPPFILVGSNLSGLARLACENPEAVTPEQLRVWLAGFPDGRDWGGREALSCADELYNEFVRINLSRGSLTLDWVRSRAWQLKQKYGAPRGQPDHDPRPGPGERGRGPISPHPPRPTPDPWHGG